MADESGLEFSANVALVSEYRFRGVDLSGGEIAIQGGFDVAHDSGFYVGTWASSLDEQTVGYGSTELDLYGGWGGAIAEGVSADIGLIGYLYPDAGPGDFDYVEVYGSLTGELGPASVTGGIAYAPDQDSLGGSDNLYLYTDVAVGIPDTPVTLNGHLGYTDGFLTFTTDSEALDWSIGADFVTGPVTFSLAYVGVEGDALIDPGGTFTDDAVVASVSASF
ncbi:TorF family putative porin [Qipengyuania nanhaisediminis]|uniref:TorF family putative porin n=1 Tax=Qipengyuania nanhaisediminis TaxID=604088 RepID=UPI0038B28C2E